MYQAGKRVIIQNKRRALLWLGIAMIVLGVLAVTGVYSATHFFKSDTTISSQTKPIVNTVIARTMPTKMYSMGIFSLRLPKDWKYIGRTQDIYRAYQYENTASNPGVRVLAIYIDSIPTTLGVNRVLPVEASGNRVISTTASANCSTFTGNKVPGSPQTPAKWAGVHFLCDLANYERNVIGTSSPSAINSVTLTGAASGQHNLFFTYTDNSGEPNDQIFYAALQSFRLR